MAYDDDRQAGSGGLSLGAAAILLLVALFFIVMGLVFSLLAGLFAAPVLMLAARVPPGGARLEFGPAYAAAAGGTFAALAVVAGLVYLLPEAISSPMLWQIDHWLPHLLPASLVPPAWRAPRGAPVAQWAMVAVPGLLAYALALRSAGEPFHDTIGLLRGMLSAVPALAVGLGCAGAVVAIAVARVQSRQMALASTFSSTLFLAVLGFLVALVGALVAAAVLVLVTRWLWRHPDVPFRRAYRTTFFGLLAYLVLTGVVIFLLPDENPLPRLAYLLAQSRNPALLLHAIQRLPVGPALLSLSMAQAPGLAVLAAIVAGGLPEAYRGVWGYLRAFAAGTAGVVSIVAGAACLLAVGT